MKNLRKNRFYYGFILLVVLIVLFVGYSTMQEKSQSIDFKTRIKACQNTQSQSCWKEIAAIVTREKGLEKALSTMADLQKNPSFNPYCHIFAHEVGHTYAKKLSAYYKEGKKISLPDNISLCGNGIIHGVLADVKTKEDTVLASKFCDYIDKSTSVRGVLKQCYHSMGHAIRLPLTRIDDLDSVVATGIELCSFLPKENAACISSMFDSIFVQPVVRNYYVSVDDLEGFSLCNNIQKYAKECVISVTQTIILPKRLAKNKSTFFTSQDKKELLNLAESLEDRAGQAVIRALLVHFLQSDPHMPTSEIVDICNSLKSELMQDCIASSVYGKLLISTSETQNDLIQFCKGNLLSIEQQEMCFDSFITYSSDFYSAEIVQNMCEKLPQRYRDRCFDTLN